jgi:hypothetical protein
MALLEKRLGECLSGTYFRSCSYGNHRKNIVMNQKALNIKPIPLRFFVVTFLWSWLLWLPFVLGGVGIWGWNESLRSSLSMPAILLGAFGPGIGALYSIRTGQGKSAVKPFLKSFLSNLVGKSGLSFLVLWALPIFWPGIFPGFLVMKDCQCSCRRFMFSRFIGL